jgi:hypothetical protein
MRARKTVRLWFSRYLYLGAATWLLFALPAEAAGTNQEAVKKVIALNKEARQFFDAMEFTLAEKSLKKALEIGEEAGLGPHVVMAGTHGNLGVLYATGIKDEAQALFQFKKALELRPDYVPNKDLNSPEVDELFKRARSEMEPEAAPPVTETAEPPAPSVGQLRCPVANVAKAGSAPKLRCVADGPLSAKEVIVYFRAGEDAEFRSRKMAPESTLDGSPGWAAQLPKDATSGEQLFLYFQARNKKGEVISSVGSAENPTTIGIRASDEGSSGTGSRSRSGRGVDYGEGLGEGEGEGGEASPWWLGLGLGTGFGYAGGSGPEVHKKTDFVAGYAWALLGQVTPEVGYFMLPNLSLSLQGRFQYIPQTAGNPTATGAVAFLARLLYLSNGPLVRFYGGPVLGGGQGFRLFVSGLKWQGHSGHVADTVRGGWFLFGAAGGLALRLSESWSAYAETNILVGEPSFSMVVDFNAGVRFRL